jgi:Protein of unknown function (DUF3575)
MKKILIYCFLFLAVFAQDSLTAQVDVTIHPISFFLKGAALGVHAGLTKHIGINTCLKYSEDNVFGTFRPHFKMTIMGAYYFSRKKVNAGFYSGLFGQYDWLRYDFSGILSSDGPFYTARLIGLGGSIGYKFVSKGKFVLDIGFGVGHAFIVKDNEPYREFSTTNVVVHNGKIGLGYRF